MSHLYIATLLCDTERLKGTHCIQKQSCLPGVRVVVPKLTPSYALHSPALHKHHHHHRGRRHHLGHNVTSTVFEHSYIIMASQYVGSIVLPVTVDDDG